MSGEGSFLVAVQPELLGLLLTEILASLRDNPVINASGRPMPLTTGRYLAALISDRSPDETLADVVITLPPPGESRGLVWQGGETRPLTITCTQDVFDALDRYCPPQTEPDASAPTT